MKRLLAILLCLVMVLLMAACNQEESQPQDEGGNAPSVETPAPVETAAPDEEPSDEEREMIYKFRGIVQELDYYTENGHFEKGFVYSCKGHQGCHEYSLSWTTIATQWALSYCYDQLQSMSAVDKWAGSQWAQDRELTINRQEILAKFTVLEDKFIRTTYRNLDALGQYTDDGYPQGNLYLEYDEQGRIIKECSYYPSIYQSIARYADQSDALYTYNPDGTIATIDVGPDVLIPGCDAEARLTPVYDANGNIATMTYLDAQGGEGSSEFTYDEQGRLISVHSTIPQYDGRLQEKVWTYTYDASGNLIEEEIKEPNKMPILYLYAYDADNRLISVTEQDYLREYSTTYTHDDAGRIIACDIEQRDNAIQHHDYFYGDFYIYNP